MHPPRPNIPSRRGWYPVLALLATLVPSKISAAPGPRRVADDSAAFDFGALQILDSTPTHTHHHHSIPPKYSPGPDGIWRRIESYTLVGSTICDTCTTTPTPTPSPSEDDIRAAVPPDWIRDTPSNPVKTSITIALSIVLACVIFLTLLRFHFVRGHSPRPRTDVEKKRHRASAQSTETLNDLKAGNNAQPTKHKWMARATARWRDNVRLLARQRRARRQRDLSSASRRGSSESLVTPAPQAPPRPASPAPSALSSSSLSAASVSTTSLASLAPPPEPELDHQIPESPNEPPAYPTPSITVSPTAAGPSRERKAPMDGMHLALDPADDGEAFPPYTPRAETGADAASYFDMPAPQVHSAHVATDDKALLALLAERASAPPPHPRLRGERSGETLASTRTTATSTSTSSAPSSSASTSATSYAGDEVDVGEARAPEEDDLPLDFHLEYTALEGINTDAPTFEAERTTAGPSRLPAPPAPPRAHGSEKMALERAYAVREADLAQAASYPHAYDAPTPMYPSAPAYAFPEEPEAGPSTPRASGLPSAPPLVEGCEYEFEGFEWDVRRGEEASAPPLFDDDDAQFEEESVSVEGQQRERGDADADADLSRKPQEREQRRDRHAHAPMSAGEAHDTGWDGGPALVASTSAGEESEGGQGHDR